MNFDPTTLIGKFIVAYIRVSSDKQDAARQRSNINAWAARYGLTIGDWLADTEGRNPRDKADKRLNFQRLLRQVESGTVDAIVVDAQDRFGTANAHQWGKFLWELAEHGTELWSVAQGNLSSPDAATVLTGTIGALTSEGEQRDKAHRNITGKIQKAKAGEYQGGYPPFGCDVVCFNAEGQEQWRVVWTGHFQRIKVTGQQQEKFEGRHNFPAKNATDVLRVRPSIRTERLDVVRQIFNWYAHESISPTQIANRLTAMKIDPVFSMSWNKVRVKALLGNPVYTGNPTWNKRAASRFAEFVNGQVQPVKAVKGKIQTGRKRAPQDYVQAAKPQFRAIVSSELFARVQEKLAASSEVHRNPNRKPPRTAALWLRGLLICGKCGEPMRASASIKQRNTPSYFCGSYGTYGKHNPKGCRCHRVKADLLHAIVQRYLDESHDKIASLMKAHDLGQLSAFRANEGELETKRQELFALIESMAESVSAFTTSMGGSKKMMAEFQAWIRKKHGGLFRHSTPLQNLYEFAYERQAPGIEATLARLDAEHTQLVERVLSLPTTAKAAVAKANKRIVELESAMDECRTELDNLSAHYETLGSQLETRLAAIEAARDSVKKDANDRRKAELVRQVIERIVCRFTYADKPAANEPKSYLESLEIIPIEGDAQVCLPNGNTLGRGCCAEALAWTLAGEALTPFRHGPDTA